MSVPTIRQYISGCDRVDDGTSGTLVPRGSVSLSWYYQLSVSDSVVGICITVTTTVPMCCGSACLAYVDSHSGLRVLTYINLCWGENHFGIKTFDCPFSCLLVRMQLRTTGRRRRGVVL